MPWRTESVVAVLLAAFTLAACDSQERANMSIPELALHTVTGPIELVRISPGRFLMGSPQEEPGHARNEEPQRRIRISRAFYLGRYQITRAQYRDVMGRTPEGPEGDTRAVSGVRYADAIEFCRRLSGTAKMTVRLPTEAEWEYACRAGTQTPYYSGTSEADLARVAWYSGNSEGKPHPVGEKQPNAWGLYDTHGNVWEYCGDYVEDYAKMADTDPVGLVNPRHGGMRGGGWLHGPEQCRAATRMISDDAFGGAGFRVAVNADR
jgi:formylglycine-generating enzyme required for sulfatase activity